MKKIILLLFVLILTGCQATYQLDINQNLGYTEKFTIKQANTAYKNTSEVLKEMQDQIDYETISNKYVLDVSIEDNDLLISGQENETNITALKDSTFINSLYQKVKITDSSIHLYNYDNLTAYSDGGDSPYLVEDIDLYITMPFRISEHNALKLIKSTNTLVYKIKDNQYPEQIMIKFDNTKRFDEQYWTDIFKYINPDLFFGILIIIVITLISLIFYKINRKKPKEYRINY